MPELNPTVTPTNDAPVTEAPAPVPAAPKVAKPKAVKPKAVKKATPKAEKPAKAKPAPVKKPVASKTKSNTDVHKKDRSMSDLTPAQRSAKVLGAMRKLGAVNGGSAVNVAAIAKKTDLGEYEVYCAMWGKGPLQSGGYVKQVKVEGVRGAAFHLTAKGQKGDPE